MLERRGVGGWAAEDSPLDEGEFEYLLFAWFPRLERGSEISNSNRVRCEQVLMPATNQHDCHKSQRGERRKLSTNFPLTASAYTEREETSACVCVRACVRSCACVRAHGWLCLWVCLSAGDRRCDGCTSWSSQWQLATHGKYHRWLLSPSLLLPLFFHPHPR